MQPADPGIPQVRGVSPASTSDNWTLRIRPVTGWFDIHLGELWRYRDLIMLFVQRDFVTVYKQTVLGPLWYLIQPILTTLVFTVIFGSMAKIPTDGIPPPLFYLSGIIVWRYFSDCLTKTSNTFASNAHIFGKVYFPRLTVPVSVVISNLICFGIQLMLFAGTYGFYLANGAAFRPSAWILLAPLAILQIAALGLGCGIIVSSLTTKYRDLAQLVGFGVQLWMYATPVVYPLSIIPEKWRWIMVLNPMTSPMELLRAIVFQVGSVNLAEIALSLCATFGLLLLGIILFSRVEKSFMDTV